MRLDCGRAIPFAELETGLQQSNIVIAATDSPDYLITQNMVASTHAGRQGEGLFIFDLAVPRDVDPQIATMEGVSLFNIDDLSSIAEENLEERKRAAVDAQEIVESEVARFMQWWNSLDVIPTIRALRQQAEDTRRRELAYALDKLQGLSSDEIDVVEALTRSIVNKLLHDPTTALKKGADKSQLMAARDLFGLWDDDNPALP